MISPRELKGRYVGCRTCKRKELVPMVAWSDVFDFVIMLCEVATLVVLLKRKK